MPKRKYGDVDNNGNNDIVNKKKFTVSRGTVKLLSSSSDVHYAIATSTKKFFEKIKSGLILSDKLRNIFELVRISKVVEFEKDNIGYYSYKEEKLIPFKRLSMCEKDEDYENIINDDVNFVIHYESDNEMMVLVRKNFRDELLKEISNFNIKRDMFIFFETSGIYLQGIASKFEVKTLIEGDVYHKDKDIFLRIYESLEDED